MRRLSLLYVIGFTTVLSVLTAQMAISSYQGTPDYTNDRVVPLMTSPTDLNSNGSGFLYSSRIVFTSGHTAFTFNNGERVEFRPFLAVGKPNTDIKTIGQGVKVIKRISAPKYLPTTDPDLNDFSILILEKDLMKVEPAQLLTPEIERELVQKRAEVKLHGYGNTEDLCAPGEALPCKIDKFKASDVPRSITATLRLASDFPELVGYSVAPRLQDQLLFFTPGKVSMCGGDSGGSLTTTYNGKLLYLANIGTGQNIYACGQSRSFDGRGGINYSQPIYRYADLIREAEAFVADQIAKEKATTPTPAASATTTATPTPAVTKSAKAKSTITCVKGKTTKTFKGPNAKCPKGYTKK